jgi:hypothetical protein
MKHKPTTPQPMQVQDLIAELQRHDPKAKLAFTFPRGGDESGECFIERMPTIPGAARVEIRMNLGCETVTAEECNDRVIDAQVEALRGVRLDIDSAVSKLGVKL